MTHSPEPWKQYNKGADMFHVGKHGKIAWLKPAGASELDYEDCCFLVPRIVACVNACQGVPTGILELKPHPMMRDWLDKLQRLIAKYGHDDDDFNWLIEEVTNLRSRMMTDYVLRNGDPMKQATKEEVENYRKNDPYQD